MSENPNPTRCGRCGTDNPPGQEFCLTCHAPLTITADVEALNETPEAEDGLKLHEAGDATDAPGVVLMGGMGGPPIPVPTERIDPEPDRPPRA
jgi:hypothetical protein